MLFEWRALLVSTYRVSPFFICYPAPDTVPAKLYFWPHAWERLPVFDSTPTHPDQRLNSVDKYCQQLHMYKGEQHAPVACPLLLRHCCEKQCLLAAFSLDAESKDALYAFIHASMNAVIKAQTQPQPSTACFVWGGRLQPLVSSSAIALTVHFLQRT